MGAALLRLHGGGPMSGPARQDNTACSAFADELGLVVVSVGYRLAPRHPFPAAIDDGYTVWSSMVDRVAVRYSLYCV